MSAGPKRIRRAVFAVRGIDCATCALGIERRVKRVDGVESVKAAIMLNKVFIDYDESKVDIPSITEAIRQAGYSNHLVRETE